MPYIPDGITEIDDHVETQLRDAANAVEPALREAGRVAKKVGIDAAQSGYSGLTWFGRRVLRVWNAVERAATPPWTVGKTVLWILVCFALAGATVLIYQVQYGILTLPMIEDAGTRFINAMNSLGPIGLFGLTAVTTLFFMFIPTEPFFIVALTGGDGPLTYVIAAAAGSSVGAYANYFFGWRLRVSAGKETGEERKLGTWGRRAHSKWGTLLLFLCSALPAPEIVALAYGLSDYPFKKFAVVMFVGRLVKWSWIAAAFLLLQLSF